MAVNAIPEGFYSVTPYLMLDNARQAIEFYKNAFAATELMCFDLPDGTIAHAEIQIGNSPIMLADDQSEQCFQKAPVHLSATSVGIMLYVEDVDTVFNQAIKLGATQLRPLENQFYGDRTATLKDPFGHVWTLATHFEDVSPEEMQRRMADMMPKE